LFGEGWGNEDDYEEENDDRGRVDLHNLWWANKFSDNEDLFDVNMDEGGGGVGPSTQNGSTSNVEAGSQYDRNEEGGEEGDEYVRNDEGSDDNSHGQQAEDHSEEHDVDRSQSSGKFMKIIWRWWWCWQ
jgi:hypothetical protein